MYLALQPPVRAWQGGGAVHGRVYMGDRGGMHGRGHGRGVCVVGGGGVLGWGCMAGGMCDRRCA